MKTLLLCVVVIGSLSACAGPGYKPLPAGADETVVRQTWGPPSGRYELPGGGTRLEYATGPYGRSTWMVDLDAAGRSTAARNVLEWRALQVAQAQLPGMSRDEVLRTLGRPGEVRSGGRQGGQVWSWRFDSPFCLWFQSSIGDDGRARDGVFSPDPLCDDDGDRTNL
ncbi:MAG: hypothetical protein ABIX12_01915 [Rubrivivax sp.]